MENGNDVSGNKTCRNNELTVSCNISLRELYITCKKFPAMSNGSFLGASD
jgi:hypothetical protein